MTDRIFNGDLVRVVCRNKSVYSGYLIIRYVALVLEKNNKPDPEIGIIQDDRFANEEGEFGETHIRLSEVESIFKLNKRTGELEE